MTRDVCCNSNEDFFVKDIALAEIGKNRVLNARMDMKGLDNILDRYGIDLPLKGARITGCVSVTYETANLIITLQGLGASLRWCPDNPGASKDDACAFIASLGMPVFATGDMSNSELNTAYNRALNFIDDDGKVIGPNLLIDDGCDITRFVHNHRPELIEGILGVTEQTTCGIVEQKRMRAQGQLKVPVIDVNNSKTKTEFDNYYGIQQSILSALDIAANVQLRGKTIVIAGYGPVGKGCAEILSSLGAKMIVTEIDSFNALQALMNGYDVRRMEDAAEQGDIFITATGCIDVITKEHFYKMKSGAILCNAGHGDNEFNMQYLRDNNIGRVRVNEYLEEYKLDNGNRIRVICDGFLSNMRIGSGNPPLGMSITFVNHILAQMDLFKNPEEYERGEIYRQPAATEREVIDLVFPDLSKALTKLTPSQASYLGRAA